MIVKMQTIIRMGLIKKLAQLFIIPLFITAVPIKGHCCDHSRVTPILKTMPKEDQQTLKDLFQLLFSSGDFAYTFLDVKPMCQISYTMQYIRNFPENERCSRETHLARKGFEVWEHTHSQTHTHTHRHTQTHTHTYKYAHTHTQTHTHLAT